MRRDLLRALAISGGDAKEKLFVSAVEKIEQVRLELRMTSKNLEEVERLLRIRKEKLEELLPSASLLLSLQPLPPFPSSLFSYPKEKIEGQWFTLTKPTYVDCLGHNDDGNPMYHLGRMSFEMFRPGDLVCAIEAVFNPIMEVVGGENCGLSHDEYDESEKRKRKNYHFSVPTSLQDEVRRALGASMKNDEAPVLRTYQ